MIYRVEQRVPNVTARYFQCRSPGYDTHADQGGPSLNGRHGSLLAELGDSLKVFYEDLEDIGPVDAGPASTYWTVENFDLPLFSA